MRKALHLDSAVFQHVEQHILSPMKYDTDEPANSPILHCIGQTFIYALQQILYPTAIKALEEGLALT